MRVQLVTVMTTLGDLSGCCVRASQTTSDCDVIAQNTGWKSACEMLLSEHENIEMKRSCKPRSACYERFHASTNIPVA